MLVDSSDFDRNTVTVPFIPLVAYYLDRFVLAVFLGNCILSSSSIIVSIAQIFFSATYCIMPSLY